MRRGWLGICACAAALLIFLAVGTAEAAKTSVSQAQWDLYLQILQDPTNSELNLSYAREAEAQGEARLALAAYERVLLNDPDNEEARDGYQRVRRMLQPPSTQARIQVGVGTESNPRNLQDGSDDESVIIVIADIRDERTIDMTRWRTSASLSGEYISNIEDLTYGYVGARTGPIFDVGPGITLYPSLGGGAATLDERLYYAEGFAGVTMEGRFSGVFERLSLGLGYRSYGEDMTADQGLYAELAGQVYFPDSFGLDGVAFIAPWVRWSGIEGSVRNDVDEEVSPARYVEWGLETGYYYSLWSDLTVGVTVRGRQRLFLKTFVDGDKRNDYFVSPGVNARLSNIFSCACDILVDYRYRMNMSNDDTADYVGNRVTVSLATRF